MPHGNDPDDFPLHAIKISIWSNYQLTVWKVWKFRDETTRFGKLLEPAQNRFCPLSKA
jgi:hypothetical protein